MSEYISENIAEKSTENNKSGTRFIVVAGGVISGVGKGVASASIGKILKEHGYSTTLIKVDPYINFDAGTLRPTEHGEVWVTQDGGEIDQDLGTYERFMNADMPKKNSITTGQIYKAVIDKERSGDYLGQTVQFIPHILDEIILRIKQAAQGYDMAVVEIGGVIGDYENTPFLFAFKALRRELGADYVACCLVSYLPVPSHIGDIKTKPTQHAVRMLSEQGIFPDFVICRSKHALDSACKKKLEMMLGVNAGAIIDAPDIDHIYDVPLSFEEQELGKKLLSHFRLESKQKPDWTPWIACIDAIKQPKKEIRIAIVGKYVESGTLGLIDSYLSIKNALVHAGAHEGVRIVIDWIDATLFEQDAAQLTRLDEVDGMIIPGGFGAGGVEGKIKAIAYVRQKNIPFLGICYGMQLAAVEYARNMCKLPDAHTQEVDPAALHQIIAILPIQKEFLENNNYGGTMRLGAYSARVKPGSLVEKLYAHVIKDGEIFERHRHRYEVNPVYVAQLEQAGFIFSATHDRADGTRLMEFAEIPVHRFFVATQAHPEFTSRLVQPNPLFKGFVAASAAYAQEREDKLGLVGVAARKSATLAC